MSALAAERLDVSSVHAASAAVANAFANWCFSSQDERADLLTQLARHLEQDREPLIRLAMDETSLGEQRLQGEFTRTVYQLDGFAQRLRDRRLIQAVDEPPVAGPPPAGHPRLQRVLVGVGPVAMFAASNFPFAFSVLGGDTASALAAGCTVVVRAHPGHPRLSRQVFATVQRVLSLQPQWHDLVTLVDGDSHEVGASLVRHPAICAVAFTGSFAGGNALSRIAGQRPRPIPFFGEMGSINPVVILPGAAQLTPDAAKELATSITASSGQMCTSPGVLLLLDERRSLEFVAHLGAALGQLPTHAMLTPGIRDNFDRGVARWESHDALTVHRSASAPAQAGAPVPMVGVAKGRDFIHSHALREEVFGPACLAVLCTDETEMLAALRAVEGSLTVTLWGLAPDQPRRNEFIQAAMSVGGRVLFGGVPTGVAVAEAQHHGGPWPSTTAPGYTAVGYNAVTRFLRPVALQGAPEWVDASLEASRA